MDSRPHPILSSMWMVSKKLLYYSFLILDTQSFSILVPVIENQRDEDNHCMIPIYSNSAAPGNVNENHLLIKVYISSIRLRESEEKEH